MERLDHLERLPFDSYYSSHLERIQEEDYLFLTSRGVTHEMALERLGISQDTFNKRKERHGWGSR